MINNKLFNDINKKIEYHLIKNMEKGGRPAKLKIINKNIKLKLILRGIIWKFLDILNNKSMKVNDKMETE